MSRKSVDRAETVGRVQERLVRDLARIERFSRRVLHRPLRSYQLPIARAIIDSVLERRGLSFAVMLPRQSGKNETAAHIEAFLLNLHRRRGGFVVKASPTFRPQAYNSMMRLCALLEGSLLPPPVQERGFMVRVGRARAAFFSAAPSANVVGATASILLEADEAQDIDAATWAKDFRPMGASTNVTSVLWGTAWTSQSLLARSMRALRQQQERDGLQRVFEVPWQRVADELPDYGRYVRAETERLGRQHPLIRTQYYLEEIDDAAGLFPESTRVLMLGSHLRQRRPTEGRSYALLVDVAGEAETHVSDELLREQQPRRDSTAVTVVEMAPSDLGLNRYLVMDRYWWTGTPHADLLGALLHLAELWQAQRVVVDATGVGAGLAAFLSRALGSRVTPFQFNAATKSDLGWAFLGICNSGRFLDYRDDGGPEWAQFWREVAAAGYEVLAGPQRRMRWGVDAPTVHDDLLISAALCATLEQNAPTLPGASHVIEALDPLVTGEGLSGVICL